MNIPKSISFDTLLIILGVGMFLLPFYYNISFSTFFFVSGPILVLFGAKFSLESFLSEKEIVNLENAKLKNEYKQYFLQNHLISKKTKIQLEKEIRQLIN